MCNVLLFMYLQLDELLKNLDAWTNGRIFQFGRSLDDLFLCISPIKQIDIQVFIIIWTHGRKFSNLFPDNHS